MKAPEKGQDLEGGSKKYLSTASLTQCVNISIYAVTPPDSDLCCCLVHKDVWLGKAVNIFF